MNLVDQHLAASFAEDDQEVHAVLSKDRIENMICQWTSLSIPERSADIT